MKIKLTLIYCILFVLLSCNNEESKVTEINPPAAGFNIAGSDKEAITIADEVMAAMGGRKAWDDARFFTWTFFDFRELIWDKKTGDVRIESFPDSSIYLLNINTTEGKFMANETEITQSDSLKVHLERGKSIWINDSYWLLMPFKLKDTGVTLKYVGEKKTEDGRLADILSLSFKDVGDTPQNKYHVFVDKESKLVSQWSFFRNAEQDTATFTTPWKDYQQYGNLLLSGDRGKNKLSKISVESEMNGQVFTTF